MAANNNNDLQATADAQIAKISSSSRCVIFNYVFVIVIQFLSLLSRVRVYNMRMQMCVQLKN